jgi:glycosyltransferase involved in cell wall biosynthesis
MNTMIYFLALLAPILALRLRKYDVLISEHEPGPWFCFVTWRLFKVPYVLYLAQPTRLLYQRKIDRDVGLQLNRPMRLSLLLGRILRPVLYLLDKRVMESAAYAVANGSHSQKVIESIYGIKTGNCPAGAERARMKPKGKKIKDGNYILLTNRHVPQKKFEYAIEMMKILKVKFPGLRLMITGGETRYTKQLRELVRKYDLEKEVVFVGYVKERELKSWYEKATVYVYTAPEEDFGMGVIEAMAAGIPVVAWDSGGPAYTVINDQTGFLIEPYKVGVMREKVEKLLRDKRLRQQMGRAGQERAKQFTWEKHGQCLEKYLIKASKVT